MREWISMDDEDITSKVPYPVMARNLMQYVMNLRANTACKLSLIGTRIDELSDRIKDTKKTVDDFPEYVKEMRKDVKDMTLITFDKANELQGIAADLDIVQRKMDISDIRTKIESDATSIAYSVARRGISDCAHKCMDELAIKTREATMKAIRTAVTYGLPKEGGLDKVPPIMSADEIEDNNQMLASVPSLPSTNYANRGVGRSKRSKQERGDQRRPSND